VEFAWEHMHWFKEDDDGFEMDPNWWFCYRVAATNKLELLKWVREEKNCGWDSWTFSTAADEGNMEMLKYCAANQCPIDEWACAYAAKNGHLECLKYLHEDVNAPWHGDTGYEAVEHGRLHILEYLVESKYDDDDSCDLCIWIAAEYGHLDCLKYLHRTAKLPLTHVDLERAYNNNHFECVQYLLDNDCPLPRGWRYEDGELYSIETSEFESEWEAESESEWETESDMS
jgi:hypothetical protein